MSAVAADAFRTPQDQSYLLCDRHPTAGRSGSARADGVVSI